MKNWVYTIFLGLVIALISINVINGVIDTYYYYNDISHSYIAGDSKCVTSYGFFSKEFSCYKLEVK